MIAPTNFEQALALLARHGVEFIIVGGVAAVAHGAPIVTLDLDVVHRRTPDNVQRLLVTGSSDAKPGMTIDYTRAATYRTSNPQVAVVTPEGKIQPHGNGQVEITATYGDSPATMKVATTKVTIARVGNEPPISFRTQVVPVLSKLACNSGGCHGKATGQNGSSSRCSVSNRNWITSRSSMKRGEGG